MKTDVFFNPDYGKLYEEIEGGTCETFEYSGAGGTIRNMFIKRPVPWLINGVPYYDVTTPYGYGGPVVTAGEPSEAMISKYYTAWLNYCRDNRIVAEFVRFHLFDNIALRDAFPGEVTHVSDNVVRMLSDDIDDIWMQFEHKVRKNVKKAQSNDLIVTTDAIGDHLDDFLKIYYDTMQRNNAKEYYSFGRTYFQNIIDSLRGKFEFFNVWHEDTIISTELVLCSECYTYSFLGGTLDEYYPMRPNDLLKYEIIKWSKETGRKAFVLGGGYGSNDGIYRYKKAFAPGDDVPFYIGKRIVDLDMYSKLIELRKLQNTAFDAASNYFPLYRSKT